MCFHCSYTFYKKKVSSAWEKLLNKFKEQTLDFLGGILPGTFYQLAIASNTLSLCQRKASSHE